MIRIWCFHNGSYVLSVIGTHSNNGVVKNELSGKKYGMMELFSVRFKIRFLNPIETVLISVEGPQIWRIDETQTLLGDPVTAAITITTSIFTFLHLQQSSASPHLHLAPSSSRPDLAAMAAAAAASSASAASLASIVGESTHLNFSLNFATIQMVRNLWQLWLLFLIKISTINDYRPGLYENGKRIAFSLIVSLTKPCHPVDNRISCSSIMSVDWTRWWFGVYEAWYLLTNFIVHNSSITRISNTH